MSPNLGWSIGMCDYRDAFADRAAPVSDRAHSFVGRAIAHAQGRKRLGHLLRGQPEGAQYATRVRSVVQFWRVR